MRVRVATLNVWALPQPFAEHVSARMRAIGDHLSRLELDAVAFQEVWTAEARQILIGAGQRAGLVHNWHTNVSFGGSGLLVLSRLPIEHAQFERFVLRGPPEEFGQGDYLGGKGFVQIRLKTTDGPLTLINTHLQARYSSHAPDVYRGLRVGQIVQLAFRANLVRGPVVMAGDLNVKESDAGYRVLTGLTKLRDVAAELDRREPSVVGSNPYRMGSRKPDRRIDYLFTRNGGVHEIKSLSLERAFDAKLELGGERAAFSNHLGVLAEFEITRCARSIPPTADPHALKLARQLLSEGWADAMRRQKKGRAWAGAGAGCALIATAGSRRLSTTRRHLLRRALQGATLITITPTVAFSILSEVVVPNELRAFEQLTDQLARIKSETNTESIA